MIKKLIAALKQQPWFLLLLPLFFIYSGYNELFGFLTFGFVLQNLLLITALMVTLYLSTLLFFRQRMKAAVFTFFISAYFLLFGFLHDTLKQFLKQGSVLTSFTFLLPFSAVLILVIALLLLKLKKLRFQSLFLYLNVLMTALIFSEIPNTVKRYLLDKSVHNLIDFRFTVSGNYKTSAIADSLKPDIYFLVFDAMASSKSIQSQLGFDNSALDTFLTHERFHIATQSSANYNWTIHSLSTTFNMSYLPDFIAPVMNDPKAYFWGTQSILNNSLITILKEEGYDIHQYQPLSFNNKDWKSPTYFSFMKDDHFYFKTLPGRIYRDIFWNYTRVNMNWAKEIQASVNNKKRLQSKEALDATMQLIKKSCSVSGNPKLVYGHFILPHAPYIFDRNGSLIKLSNKNIDTKVDEPTAYFEQVLFADKLIQELISYIKTNNKKNTVIIVEGDHGYKDFKKVGIENTFKNLNAFYFPDKDYTSLYDSISPVNTFRVVLNKYFNAGLPLLKDSSTLVTSNTNTIISSKIK